MLFQGKNISCWERDAVHREIPVEKNTQKAVGKDNIHQESSPWEATYPQHPSYLLKSLSPYEERSCVVQGHGENALLQRS